MTQRSVYVMTFCVCDDFLQANHKHVFKNFIFLKTISKKFPVKQKYYLQSKSAENKNPQTRVWKFANCTACRNSDMHINPTQFNGWKGRRHALRWTSGCYDTRWQASHILHAHKYYLSSAKSWSPPAISKTYRPSTRYRPFHASCVLVSPPLPWSTQFSSAGRSAFIHQTVWQCTVNLNRCLHLHPHWTTLSFKANIHFLSYFVLPANCKGPQIPFQLQKLIEI
jgi:hypothetical protein